MGKLSDALQVAREGLKIADAFGTWREQLVLKIHIADALYQKGKSSEANKVYDECQLILDDYQPGIKLADIHSVHWQCDFLLSQGKHKEVQSREHGTANIYKVSRRLDQALDLLHLGCAFVSDDPAKAKKYVEQAIDKLRATRYQEYLCIGLLTRARFDRTDGDLARVRKGLQEAMGIAKRGDMRLFQCDAHLEYARLALAEGDEEQAREHVDAARRLVDETGYGRRRSEVEELEAQLR